MGVAHLRIDGGADSSTSVELLVFSFVAHYQATGSPSGENRLDYMSVHVSQATVDAVVTKRQPPVIDPH